MSDEDDGPIFTRADTHEHWRSYNQQANEFARLGLSNLVLLNGGALVAMAPIGGMFQVSIARVFPWAITSAGTFCLGLVLSVFGFLMGFLVNSSGSEMFQRHLTDSSAETIEAIRLSHNRYRKYGIWLALSGAAAFVAGLVFGAIALYVGAGSAAMN